MSATESAQAQLHIDPQVSMESLLEFYPGARRALFERYHIGGCSSCAFHPGETLEQLCQRNGALDPQEVIQHLEKSLAFDAQLMISPAELQAALAATPQLPLLDVRTREEHEAVKIPGSRLLSSDVMQELLGKHPREAALVLYDHLGPMALDAAAYFYGHGFKAVRCLHGGIDAWSQEIDPTVRRYRLE